MRNAIESIRQNWKVWMVSGVAVAAVLAPWWRNRGLLRDFFDYGLMMVASGLIAEGQRPFVDFITPMQTLSYLANFASEQLWGGTYQALTWGNAGLMLLAGTALALLLRRWLPGVMAVGLAAVVVIGSAGQHTIIWYNSLGVITLALISWAGAQAPVWRREDWGLNLVLGLGLVLSGMNKLNYHAIGLAVALAWTIRAGVLGRAGWGATVGTGCGWLVLGTVVPLGIELGWTGASWEMWRYSVIEVAFRQRGVNLWSVFTWDFYWVPMHDYYHQILRPLGAILVVWLAGVLAVGWKGRSGVDRLMLVAAGVMAAMGMGGLAATNHEIGYLAFTAGLVLLIGIWLGFGLPTRGRLPGLALWGPALGLGVVFWHSAWLGQRTLFGHSQSARADFREVAGSGGAFAYLAGTRVPPEMAADLEAVAAAYDRPDTAERPCFFYAAGVEWLQRVWPSPRVAGLPIPMAPLGYGRPEVERLRNALSAPAPFTHVLGVQSWPSWPGDLSHLVNDRAVQRRHGQFTIWEFHNNQVQGLTPTDDVIGAVNRFGGNLDGRLVAQEPGLRQLMTADGRLSLGVERGQGAFRFLAPSHSIKGEISLRRLEPAEPGPALPARFAVQVLGEDGELRHESWSERFILPAGESQAVHAVEARTDAGPSRFVVEVAPEAAGRLAASWLVPRVQSAAWNTEEAPRLRDPSPADAVGLDRAWREAVFPADWVDDVELVVRRGRLTDRGLAIDRGGEVWFRPKRAVAEWWGLFRPAGTGFDWNAPVLRAVWYNGGRIEILFQQGLPEDPGVLRARGWSPQFNGWFGVLVDRSDLEPGILFKVDQMTAR